MAMTNQHNAGAEVAEPASPATALLVRLDAINKDIADYLGTLERVEGSVVGNRPPSAEAKGSINPVYQYGGFLGELDQAIGKIERQLPSANSAIWRIKDAF